MMQLLKLFLVFAKIGLFTIGGGLAMLPLIHNEMAARQWMAEAEFLDILAVSEMTPGPMSVNAATFVGYRLGGVGGALTATLALVLPSLLIIALVGALWRKHRDAPASRRILAVVRPVISGMILAAAFKLLLACLAGGDSDFILPGGYTLDWRNLLIFSAIFIATWRFRANPLLALACGGVAGLVLMH